MGTCTNVESKRSWKKEVCRKFKVLSSLQRDFLTVFVPSIFLMTAVGRPYFSSHAVQKLQSLLFHLIGIWPRT